MVVRVQQLFACDVRREPVLEREPVAEARVDGVLEVGVRVHEARDDRGAFVPGARAELGTVYYRVRRLPAALYAFTCGGLIGSAGLVVALLYDPRYAGASIFVSLLMISTALRLPNIAAAQLMVAVGQVQKTMHMTIVRLLWVLMAIPVGFLFFGPIAVVAAIGLVEVPATIYCWLLLRRINVLNLRDELAYLGLVVAGSAIGWLGGTEVLRLFPHL